MRSNEIKEKSNSRIMRGFAKNSALVFSAVIFAFLLSEILFRVLLSLGWVNTVAETYNGNPYGFYFWSREGGYPHGINNRYGYADQDFELDDADRHKVVIIGDSFVEALQVDIDNKMGPLLQRALNNAGAKKYSVMSFGRSGEYPAYYLERYKALASTFSPDIAFVLIYMGNDFRNSSPSLENRASGVTADRYIFYQADPATRNVVLNPKSQPLVESYGPGFINSLRKASLNQQTIKQKIREIMLSNFFLFSEIPYRFDLVVKKYVTPVGANKAVPKEGVLANPRECTEETIFINSYDACWFESKTIMRHILKSFKQFQEASKSKIYFIGIPANETYWGDSEIQKVVSSLGGSMPIKQYDHYLANKYSVEIANIDLKRPNKILKELMADEGLLYIDLYDRFYYELSQNKRKVYCRWVNGHLCADGHQIVSEAMVRIVQDAR